MQIDMLQELFCMNICKGKAVRQDQGHRYLNKVFSMIHPASPLLRKCLGDTGHKSVSLRDVFTRKPQKNYKWKKRAQQVALQQRASQQDFASFALGYTWLELLADGKRRYQTRISF
jgi:hypothetical protein